MFLLPQKDPNREHSIVRYFICLDNNLTENTFPNPIINTTGLHLTRSLISSLTCTVLYRVRFLHCVYLWFVKVQSVKSELGKMWKEAVMA